MVPVVDSFVHSFTQDSFIGLIDCSSGWFICSFIHSLIHSLDWSIWIGWFQWLFL